MNNKMTIFYRKSNGDLTDIISGEQSMFMYGDLEEDYTLIYGFIIVDHDEYVMRNSRLFCIVDGTIKLKDSEAIQKYI